MPRKISGGDKSPSASKGKRKGAALTGLTLYVGDVQRSLDYYAKIPGAVVLHHSGDFAMLRIGSKFRLGLLRTTSKGFHLELESPDIDSLYAKSKSWGSIVAPLAKRPWRERSFTMKDPDGYQVEFEDGGA